MSKKVLVAMLFVLLIVTASGCVQTDDASDSPASITDQASEQEIIKNLDSEILDESETIDIGELV